MSAVGSQLMIHIFVTHFEPCKTLNLWFGEFNTFIIISFSPLVSFWAMRPIQLHRTIYAFCDNRYVFFLCNSDYFCVFFRIFVCSFVFIYFWLFQFYFHTEFRLHLFGSTIYGLVPVFSAIVPVYGGYSYAGINFGIMPKRQLKIPSIMRHINIEICAHMKIRILFRILVSFRFHCRNRQYGASVFFLLLLFCFHFDQNDCELIWI